MSGEGCGVVEIDPTIQQHNRNVLVAVGAQDTRCAAQVTLDFVVKSDDELDWIFDS
ncbi:hypothetical protein TSUD_194640 [Trifolium subterraneum]|uniref:Uncharacterized protein n=1 Tax=Trifolium subterraneum TaxID=3900 RepID=A0A2Z6P033_TRISU|nr:hypothetical protein TSUD_194640 [Trifolium subterraneum]